MTDFDFEIIESSELQTSRKGKTKYSNKLWESDDPKDKIKYALAVIRICQRRNSDYAEELIDKIDKRMAYEVMMESVFHSDPESIKVDDVEIIEYEGDDFEITEDDDVVSDVITEKDLNKIVNIKFMNDFRVMTDFDFDYEKQMIFARVPAGLVSKKMNLSEILATYQSFMQTGAFKNMKDKSKKEMLKEWCKSATSAIDELTTYGWY